MALNDNLDINGLVTSTSTEIQTEMENGYKSIYGEDINLDSNTSDAQLINILTQFNTDMREMMTEVYNTFDPDKCRGTIQDVRFKLNNLERAGGTFTIVDITIVTDRTLTLNGLDADYNDVNATAYGFSNNNGDQYYLIDSVTLLAGTHVLPFRCSKLGAENPTIGTLTNQITVIPGVISGNNASPPTTIGIDQETDEEFAFRRERSYEFRAQHANDAMQAQLLALDGVSEAYVYNHDYVNYPDGDDADGIPLHYIWVIVEGGANSDIAEVIYANIAGAGTVGAVSVETTSASGQIYVSKFDRNVSIDLHIKFEIKRIDPDFVFDQDSIKTYIAENLIYSTNEYASTAEVTEICRDAMTANGGGGVPINVEISLDGSTWVDYLPSTNKKNKFTVSATNIVISEASS